MARKSVLNSKVLQGKILTLSLVAALLATNLAWGTSLLELNAQQQLATYIQQPEPAVIPTEPTITIPESPLPENCEQLYQQVCIDNRGKGIAQQANCQHIQTMCEHIVSQRQKQK